MVPSRTVAGGGVGICDRPECRPTRDARRATPRPAPAPGATPTGPRRSTRAEAEATQLDRIRQGLPARFLNLLDHTHTPRSTAKVAGQRIPAEITKRLDPVPFVDLVHVPVSYYFERAHTGPSVILDRTAAWVAAKATVDVAHGYGGWQHTGALDLPESGPLLPGYYEVRISAWHEEAMPSPLRATKKVPVGATVWVTEPLVKLLRDLAVAKRWGGGSLDVVDSWTHPVRVRLDEGGWAAAIRDIRAQVLDEFGHGSPEYVLVKNGYAQAVTTMHGKAAKAGQPREYTPSGVHRDDIADTIKTTSAVTMWRNADAVNQLADEPVIAIQNTDELVITPGALAAITTGPHTPGRPRIDESGRKIGTYKTKRVQS